LPGRILPQSESWGTVNADGTVTIDKNWWLFLYNISMQVLGVTTGVPSVPATDLLSSDVDAAAINASVARKLAEALAVLGVDPPPAASDFPDIARALLLAQDGLLPDPTPRAQPVATVTLSASPFGYTAPFSGAVSVTGGTVSSITVGRQGTTVATGQTSGIFPLSRLDVLTVTYSAAPTMVFLPT
jgi:hypothetical protein